MEEFSELNAAIAAHATGHKRIKSVRKEIVDAHLMLLQLVHVYGFVETHKELAKATRDLDRLVKKHEQKK